MTEELKACPFCGGEPNLTHSDYVHDDLRPMPVVECKSCSAWVRAEDWNRRAQLPRQGAEAVEVVAHMYQHEETGVTGFVDQQQVDWGFEKNNPRLHLCGPLMTVAQHQRILAAQEMEWLERWMQFASEPIGQECCNRPGFECCGCPDICYRDADDIISAMHARREELRALLAKP